MNTQRQKRFLLIMIGIAILPIIAAVALYWTRDTLGSANNGVLLMAPLPLADAVPTLAEQLDEVADDRWRYVLFAGTNCDQTCQQMQQTVETAHTLLNEKQRRFVRVAVASAPVAVIDDLVLLPPTVYAQLQQQLLERTDGAIDPLMAIVDPLGNVVLVYGMAHTVTDILKDSKRLLRASRIG